MEYKKINGKNTVILSILLLILILDGLSSNGYACNSCYGCYCSIVVSTSDCGSENPGSNPGSGNFLYLFVFFNYFINVGLISEGTVERVRLDGVL